MFSRWDVLLGSQSEVLARRIKSCVSIFYGFVNLRVVFNNTYKDRFSRSQRSKVVYRASCCDCGLSASVKRNDDYMIGRLNILRLSLKIVTLPLGLTM